MAEVLSIEFPESSRHPSCDLILAIASLFAVLLAAALHHVSGAFHSRRRVVG